jgi:glucose-1-phosphate cytidylyltransferase
MKVVILAGGLGTRLSEYTKKIPKPMVSISGKPILMHIIDLYKKQGFKEFCIALGYKGDIIKEFFFDLAKINYKKRMELMNQEFVTLDISTLGLKITLANTGESTLTGGRLKRLKDYLGADTFMMTYGDGLSDIDLNALLGAHKKKKKLVTVTAVHPIARFGELLIDSCGEVVSFKEKPQLQQGWINGGFFVMEPSFIDYIDGDLTVLEKEPLESVADLKELYAFRHEGFWHCMDSQRDKEFLENLVMQDIVPWA